MLKILIFCIIQFTFLNATIKIDTNIKQFTLLDQFDKEHKITKNTKKLIFVFQKDSGHLVKDYFSTLKPDFLEKRDALFVMDLTAVPYLLKFIVLHTLTDYKYSILLMSDEELVGSYLDIKEKEKVMIVYLENFKVLDIKYLTTKEELQKVLY